MVRQNERHHPHGWCGLKFGKIRKKSNGIKSPPTRVVWIEINDDIKTFIAENVTTHTGGVDWNCVLAGNTMLSYRSPPTRVVWIEISFI